MLRFGTLGPSGSNHDWIARRYLAFHGLKDSEVRLFADFGLAFEALLAGDLEVIVQVAVHGSVTDTVVRFRGRAHLVDTFVFVQPAHGGIDSNRGREAPQPGPADGHPRACGYLEVAYSGPRTQHGRGRRGLVRGKVRFGDHPVQVRRAISTPVSHRRDDRYGRGPVAGVRPAASLRGRVAGVAGCPGEAAVRGWWASGSGLSLRPFVGSNVLTSERSPKRSFNWELRT